MLTVLQEGSLDYARDDDGAKRYQNSAALHYFLRRTFPPPEPVEPIESAEPLSHAIKGQHAPWADPDPGLLIFEPINLPPLF